MGSACFCGEHAEDTSPTAYVEDCFAFEEAGVVDDGCTIRARADFVLEHLLMDAWQETMRWERKKGEKKKIPKWAYESA